MEIFEQLKQSLIKDFGEENIYEEIDDSNYEIISKTDDSEEHDYEDINTSPESSQIRDSKKNSNSTKVEGKKTSLVSRLWNRGKQKNEDGLIPGSVVHTGSIKLDSNGVLIVEGTAANLLGNVGISL